MIRGGDPDLRFAARAQVLGLDGWAILTARDPAERVLRRALAVQVSAEQEAANRG